MGKAGRFACIFVPMALTLASLICIILVGLGGTNKSSSTLSNLYFFKVRFISFTLMSRNNMLTCLGRYIERHLQLHR